MKAKYKHYGNDCIIYNQIICVDNIVTEVESYISGWFDTTPKTNTRVCPTNAEARRIFYSLCEKYENKKYDCEYKEASSE